MGSPGVGEEAVLNRVSYQLPAYEPEKVVQ